MSMGIKNRAGQYLHADGAARKRTIKGSVYIVGIAGAYDAHGLIGPEHNGLFVLDDTEKRVLTDRNGEIASGYNGPSQAQWLNLQDVMGMSGPKFIKWIKKTERYRGGLA
jgi:hypothetical protein